MLNPENIKPDNINLLTDFLLSLSCLLLGLSILIIGPHKHFELMSLFLSIKPLFPEALFYTLAGFCFLLAGCLSLANLSIASHLSLQCLIKRLLAILLICMATLPLLSLFSSAPWIASLGGFPAIGSGQGIIKYMALLAIGITLYRPSLLSNQTLIWINFIPVATVLLWIGGMKFTAIEARGIQDLIESSPLMSWMYSFWSLQTTSNLIGIYDIIATLLLAIGTGYRQYRFILMLPALLVFLTTQTFLFSWNGALSSTSVLTAGGQFLIKDLWFVINLLFILFIPKLCKNK